MFWPTPPASLDWAWACLRLLARSRYFCVSRSERWTGAANETHRRQERAGTRRNAAQPARARLAMDARDGGEVPMPTVDQQLSAVFNAWLPFILAVVAIVGPAAVAIWRVMEWRYREQYEKTKTLYEIVISHAQHAADAASRTQADLKSANASQNEEIQKLKNLLHQLQ